MAIERRVEEKEKEILVVVKPDAIEYPGAVMIHLKYAHSTDPAVVASVWFILVAPLTTPPVSSAFFFVRELTCVKLVVGAVINPFR
jgi:hypothetical protein